MTEPWRVEESYVDDRGEERFVPAETVTAVSSAIGRPEPEWVGHVPLVVGQCWQPASDGIVGLEDGTERVVSVGDSVELPFGYHRFAMSDRVQELIVTPRRCRQPERRMWGVVAQLYAARSRRSWGIGDLRDLASLCASATRHGAGFVLVNPLHAVAPVDRQENCPYSPVSRLFRSPLYLSVTDVPGAGATDLTDLATAAAVVNSSSWLDRDEVWRVKRAALERIYATRTSSEMFLGWRALQPPELRRFAVWCAVSERFGPSSTAWPARLRRFDAPGVSAFAAEAADRVGFHEWLQWLLTVQQERFAGSVIHDLAVGVAPGGADAWIWPEAFVSGVTIGAPPDALNTVGQDWGMVPLHPWRLATEGYRPFIRLLRAVMSGSAGVRIDHILGLFRLWFIPAGVDPAAGTYVRYPVEDLLAILALESHRTGVPVIGEDLGTVEDGVRRRLDERGVLSSRVLVLAEQPPQRWPAGSLATVTTHDLPTVSGLWTGTDLADQEEAGAAAPAETAHLRHRLMARTGVRDPEPAPVVDAAHQLIGSSPSLLAAVALEDLCGVEHRTNIPATDRAENWTRPLPLLIDELDEVLAAAATLLDRPPGRGGAAPAADDHQQQEDFDAHHPL